MPITLGTVGNATCLLALVFAVVALVVSVYGKNKETKGGKHSDPFAFRSVADTKMRYGTSTSPGQNIGANADVEVTNFEDVADNMKDFEAAWTGAWRGDKSPSAPSDFDKVFQWQADEEECGVKSMVAPDKELATKAANPERLTTISSSRSLARFVGLNPTAALRPKTRRSISNEPIVFLDTDHRQVYINENGDGCFSKGDDLSACHFDKCKSN
jgi:hypothetical protein